MLLSIDPCLMYGAPLCGPSSVQLIRLLHIPQPIQGEPSVRRAHSSYNSGSRPVPLSLHSICGNIQRVPQLARPFFGLLTCILSRATRWRTGAPLAPLTRSTCRGAVRALCCMSLIAERQRVGGNPKRSRRSSRCTGAGTRLIAGLIMAFSLGAWVIQVRLGVPIYYGTSERSYGMPRAVCAFDTRIHAAAPLSSQRRPFLFLVIAAFGRCKPAGGL